MGPVQVVAESGSDVRIQNTFNIFLLGDAISAEAFAQAAGEAGKPLGELLAAIHIVARPKRHDSNTTSPQQPSERATATTGETAAAIVKLERSTRPTTAAVPADKSTRTSVTAPLRSRTSTRMHAQSSTRRTTARPTRPPPVAIGRPKRDTNKNASAATSKGATAVDDSIESSFRKAQTDAEAVEVVRPSPEVRHSQSRPLRPRRVHVVQQQRLQHRDEDREPEFVPEHVDGISFEE